MMTATYFDGATMDRKRYAIARLVMRDRETRAELAFWLSLSDWDKAHYVTRVSLDERFIR